MFGIQLDWVTDLSQADPDSLGTKLNPKTAHTDGLVAIVAGSDTSATALSHIIYFLLRHPNVQKRLYTEIETVFPDGSDTADYTKHVEMAYLNAVMCVMTIF